MRRQREAEMSKPFMDEDFLLSGETARALYHDHAARMPIIDYHCHIDPRQIYEDKPFEDLAQAWLGGDHYKWRAMRSNGIEERFITGDASPYEKFEKWAETLPLLIGNPLYHWTHLELQRYFDIKETLSPDTCQDIWQRANEALRELTPRKIIAMSHVKVICTTDDPADDLRWHKLIREDKGFSCKVLPAFRPDKAINIDKTGFKAYLEALGAASGIEVKDFNSLKHALDQRLEFFVSMGCRAADHGLDFIPWEPDTDAAASFSKALQGEKLSAREAEGYKTQVMLHLAKRYRGLGVVMQIHYGAVRNNNPRAFSSLGPDTGYDAIGGGAQSGLRLGGLLGAMDADGGLPKTVIYSLNPADNAQIAAIIGCFQTADHPGKLQHGSAWWFNDTRTGMIEQITNLANISVLGRFIGMLTDSRSFLSYTRHEYFRRILCELIGSWVDNGEYPRDMASLGEMVENISFNNTMAYFGLTAEESI